MNDVLRDAETHHSCATVARVACACASSQSVGWFNTSALSLQIMGFGWMFVLFLLCAWQYTRLTQPAHLWIFRALYYLSRSELSASSLCNVTGHRATLPC